MDARYRHRHRLPTAPRNSDPAVDSAVVTDRTTLEQRSLRRTRLSRTFDATCRRASRRPEPTQPERLSRFLNAARRLTSHLHAFAQNRHDSAMPLLPASENGPAEIGRRQALEPAFDVELSMPCWRRGNPEILGDSAA